MTDTVEYEYRLILIEYGSTSVDFDLRAKLYEDGWSQTPQYVTQQGDRVQGFPTRYLQVWRRPLLKK